MKNLGFMQGRLVPDERNKIQSFPWQNWKKEFQLAKKLKLNIMEWTIDYENSQKIQLITMRKKNNQEIV